MTAPPRAVDVRRTLRAHESRLRAFPNVVRLAIGERVRRGRRTKGLAIRVIVSRKLKRPRRPLPRRVRGVLASGRKARFYVPIDVEAGPRRLRALQLTGGSRLRRIRSGALGLAYVSRSGRSFALTNAHVVLRQDERAQDQVVAGGAPLEDVGEVHRATTLRAGVANAMDAAVVWLYEDVAIRERRLRGIEDPILRCEAIRRLDDASYFFVNRSGTRCAFTAPNEIQGEEPVSVGGADLRFRGFWTLTRTAGPAPVPGDSGSVLVRTVPGGFAACGLVFAGAGDTLAVYPIVEALRRLGATDAGTNGSAEDVGF